MFGNIRYRLQSILPYLKIQKKRENQNGSLFLSSGDWTRTSDLRVMSPTSYLLLYPAIYIFNILLLFNSNQCPPAADMIPTSYLLLYPAIYIFNILSLFNSNQCPPAADMIPTSYPCAERSRSILLYPTI